jgi:hypothetical protein
MEGGVSKCRQTGATIPDGARTVTSSITLPVADPAPDPSSEPLFQAMTFRITARPEIFDVEGVNPQLIGGYDVSPDGREFVHRVGAAGGPDIGWIRNWPEIVCEITGVR